MRYLLLLTLLLISCSSPVEQTIDSLQIPKQYAVTAVSEDFNVKYIVRDEKFIACQSLTEERCTTDTLKSALYGKTISDMLDELDDAKQEENCLQSAQARACFDENNVVVSFTSNGEWKIEYVR